MIKNEFFYGFFHPSKLIILYATRFFEFLEADVKNNVENPVGYLNGILDGDKNSC